MRQAPPKGFTLLEVTVILVLLAVAAAVVAPLFRRPEAPNESLGGVLAGAREIAVRRAESVTLTVDRNGAWRLTPGTDTTTIAHGSLGPASQSARIRVTPLGACFSEGPGAANWDAIACAATGSRTR